MNKANRRKHPATGAVSLRQDDGTRERLLEVAEDLFGRLGYEGASVRALTRAAESNLGAITYHFGSKEALYNEAFFRHARPANERRLAELIALRSAAGKQPLAVTEVLRCLLGAPLKLAKERPGFVRLMARNVTNPPAFAADAIRREMEPVEAAFLAELARSLPGLPEPVLRFRLMLSGGGLFFLLNHWPGRVLPRRRAPLVPDLPELPPGLALELLVEFAAAGLSAPPPSGEFLGALRTLSFRK